MHFVNERQLIAKTGYHLYSCVAVEHFNVLIPIAMHKNTKPDTNDLYALNIMTHLIT